ncbi:hypothetical protein GW17_00059001 [Ensete ventricosum]|nr:hypothetical protein GW17_00059001 [Ensete ventricosum]
MEEDGAAMYTAIAEEASSGMDRAHRSLSIGRRLPLFPAAATSSTPSEIHDRSPLVHSSVNTYSAINRPTAVALSYTYSAINPHGCRLVAAATR